MLMVHSLYPKIRKFPTFQNHECRKPISWATILIKMWMIIMKERRYLRWCKDLCLTWMRMICWLLFNRWSIAHRAAYWLGLSLSMATAVQFACGRLSSGEKCGAIWKAPLPPPPPPRRTEGKKGRGSFDLSRRLVACCVVKNKHN